MAKKDKPKKNKVIYPKGEPTPSVESTYQVFGLSGEIDDNGKMFGGKWVEHYVMKSFGRKALAKKIRKQTIIGQYKIRKIT